MKKLALAVLLATSQQVNALDLDENLRIVLEQPFYRAEIGQISEIRGWALHPTEQIDVVEIYIDEQFYSIVPVGGQRGDVYNAYPDAVSSRYSGYSQTVNFKSLPQGHHSSTINLKTIDKFHKAQNALILQGVQIDQYFYNIELVWNNATQGFVIQQTTPYEDIDGDYSKHCRVCAPDM